MNTARISTANTGISMEQNTFTMSPSHSANVPLDEERAERMSRYETRHKTPPQSAREESTMQSSFNLSLFIFRMKANETKAVHNRTEITM